jgi:hypothetical protein
MMVTPICCPVKNAMAQAELKRGVFAKLRAVTRAEFELFVLENASKIKDYRFIKITMFLINT